MALLSLSPLPRSPVVRMLVYINCAVLVTVGFLSFFINLLDFLDPTLPVLSLYMCLFGCLATGAELGLDSIATHFDFLRQSMGEAVFFIFVGTLGLSFGLNGVLALLAGLYSTVVGVICLGDHFVCGRDAASSGDGDAGGTAVAVTMASPRPAGTATV